MLFWNESTADNNRVEIVSKHYDLPQVRARLTCAEHAKDAIDKWTAFVESLMNDQEALTVLTSGDTTRIAALAQSKGFNLTEQDIEDAKLEHGELGKEALESIAGGFAKPRIFNV